MSASTGPRRLLVFTGDGKGKTTAALGMALRACGHGLRVLVIQFLKSDSSTGEIAAVRHLPGVEIVQTGLGFVPRPTHPAYTDHRKAAQDGLEMAGRVLGEGRHELVILDEVCTAVSLGLLEEKAVLEVVGKANAHVVMTGRGATEGLLAASDTASDIRCLKHGMQQGKAADKGVEM